MNRMRRTLGILPVAALVLAACAAPGTGAGDSDTSPAASATSPAASAPASDVAGRVDIGDLYADPGAFAGQEVTILGRVDAIAVEGGAFLTSPSGEEDGLLVVLAEDATIDKEIAEKSVLWITGSVVPLSAEDLEAAGAAVSADDAGLADYAGEYVVVANEIGDPLTSE
jgi:hypothetical protein